ncbi:MAG: 3-isopropylmalate dehydratase small subunit [Vulcanimicrobiaceae bacterium]
MIVESSILPIPRANIDTDQIIPASKLTGISKTGLGEFLFAGMPGGAALLAEHAGAQIVLALDNFGCGSSREHAVWALVDRGFRAVVAPSFARIFNENAYANGLVPIALPAETVQALFDAQRIRIDVESQTLEDDRGSRYAFDLDPLRKRFLLDGGFLEFLAGRIPAIRAWEALRSGAGPDVVEQA